MGKLVCGVSLPHEDEWVAHAAAIKQPGAEDQVESILFSTSTAREGSSYTHTTRSLAHNWPKRAPNDLV